MQTELDRTVVEYAIGEGAAKVGFADLSPLSPDVRQGMPLGISIAVALTPAIIDGISGGPTLEYEAEYERANALLDEIGGKLAVFLQERGYGAVSVPALGVGFDRETLSTTLPHKTSATLSAMGWIGKCALLVTEEYGSAVRLTTVLTDAPLATAEPIEESRCGECSICTDVCPGSALEGTLWQAGMARGDMYDVFTCAKTAKGLSVEQGIKNILCGKCMVECPWTRSYLDKHV